MSTEAVETIASLVAKIKGGRAAPVDIMLLYKALAQLPPAAASQVIEETTAGEYMVVPTAPPESWNAHMRKAYAIFLNKVRDSMVQPEPAKQTAPDA